MKSDTPIRRSARLVAATIVAGVLLAGCVSAPSAGTDSGRGGGAAGDLPDWYLNPQSVYPDNQFLTSVGTGDSRRDAEQQALAGLSQIFEAEIEVDVETRERYRELVTADGAFSESDVQLAQTTNIRAAQTLLNVQFGEAAVDELGRVHVIAWIERIPTGRLYVDLIDKNARQVESFLGSAARSDGILREYAYLSAATVVATNNEVLRDQLRIIAPGMGEMARVSYDFNELLQQRADLASAMTVSVAVDGDRDDRVGAAVREALSAERFPVVTSGAVLSVTGRASVEPVELSNDFETVRWVLTLEMRGPDGASLVTFDDQNRASAVTVDSAIAFAYRDIEEVITDDFVSSIRAYFDGLVLGN